MCCDPADGKYSLLDKITDERGYQYVYSRILINAPTELAEEYWELLEAPHKEIVQFEHSEHKPWINETEKFIEGVERLGKQTRE